MNKKSTDGNCCQDSFLHQLQQSAVAVAVYLKNGIKLIGTIVAHDTYVIIIQNPDRTQQIVFKHAMATISPIVGPKT